MKPVISLGTQSFEKLRQSHSFYIDKSLLIQEWWENQDDVTLVTRPRRFGKLEQIEEKAYDTELMARGISRSRIRHYGFAFEGKKVLIG